MGTRAYCCLAALCLSGALALPAHTAARVSGGQGSGQKHVLYTRHYERAACHSKAHRRAKRQRRCGLRAFVSRAVTLHSRRERGHPGKHPGPPADTAPAPQTEPPPDPEPAWHEVETEVLLHCDVTLTTKSELQANINANPEGTTFCLQAGTYELSHHIAPRSHDRLVGEGEVILDGGEDVEYGIYGKGGQNGDSHVTVEHVIVQHFTGAGIHLGWYAYIAYSTMRDNQRGVKLIFYSTLNHNTIKDNYQYGIEGNGQELLIENNTLDHNNTSKYCGGKCYGDAGGSKITGAEGETDNLVWKTNTVKDNIGIGIWSDIGVESAVYEGNTIDDNTESGLFHEVSSEAVIRNNALEDNATTAAGKSCWEGSQIDTQNSTNLEVYGNTVVGNHGENGICASARVREAEPHASLELKGLYVHDNAVYMREGASSGIVGLASAGREEAENRFVHNTYYLADGEAAYWPWPLEGAQTWETWQAHGQDTTGTVHLWE